MSRAISSARQQRQSYSEDTEVLYDPYAGFEIENACAEIPWPEWNDAVINAETWNAGTGGKAPVSGDKSVSSFSEGSSFFVDPNPPSLPPPISDYVNVWKRPHLVFPGKDLVVFSPVNMEFELQVSSTLASECGYFKNFIEQLQILQFYAVKYKFQVEMENSNFVSNTQGEIWRPWHLVYGMCKAGKGQFHKPLYCPYGKYIVRLFYMGVWRMFVVDDQIPCDVEGKCMLPTTQIPGELWPIILTKAVLKILSLTPSSDLSATDFRFLSTLTAWAHHQFSTESKTPDQLWRRLTSFAPHYEKPNGGSSPEIIHSSRIQMDTSKKNSGRSAEKEDAGSKRFCFLLANLIGLQENFPMHCSTAVTMTRDCPLVKANKREPTKPWKRIRWIYWAKKKGLWVDENQLPPYRRLNIIMFCPRLSYFLTPDAKLEAALYDIPVDDDSGTEETFTEESGIFEPEQWCDFYKFLEYLVGMDVLFKPSYFTYSGKVTCLKGEVQEKSPGGKSATKSANITENCFMYSNKLKDSFNEPVFLLCEAVTGIFLCFSLWVHPQEAKAGFGYLDANQPKIVKVAHASLVIEKFDWTSSEEGQIIGLVKTVGYSSAVLNLEPGRYILRLWITSDSPYVLHIFSNVPVTTCRSTRARFLMLDESQRVLNYINNVSNSFMSLTQTFGKPGFAAALRDFYNTIVKPRNDVIEGYRKLLDEFIDVFVNCILQALKDLIPNTEEMAWTMWALQSLFLNPSLKCNLPLGFSKPSSQPAKKTVKKSASFQVERSLPEILSSINLPDDLNKVVLIQKVFRGYQVRLLWKRQSPGSKDYKMFTERLKKICDVMFIPQKRDVEVGKLLRLIITTKPELGTVLKFHRDFLNAVEVEEFNGKIPNVEPFAWVPMARFVVASHSPVPTPCAFYLSCNLEQSMLMVFDNDSGVELFRVTNTVSPHYYYHNVKGYTVFVFGWNEASVKTVNWRIQMVKMKYSQSLHLCNLLMSSECQPYPMPNLELFELKNSYVPNRKSRIFRCIINIHKNTLLTLRLSTSYSEVQFLVIVKLRTSYWEESSGAESIQSDDVIRKVFSENGTAIVPMLLLEHSGNLYGEGFNENSDSTSYILEAYIQNDSWPLTKQEWGLVEPMRVNGELWKDSSATNIQYKRGESKRKLQRTSRKSTEQKVESPFWLVQVLYDSPGQETEASVKIEEDKSYSEILRAMKMSWEEKEPGRRKKGRELRMNFLYMLYLEERNNNFEYGEGFGEDYDALSSPQEVLDRLSSLSYLTSDFSSTRYIYSPRKLPVTPLCDLYFKYRIFGDSSQEKLSTSQDSKQSFPVFVSASDMIETLEESRDQYLQQSLRYRSILAAFMEAEQKLSNRLMEQAYDARSKLIDRRLR